MENTLKSWSNISLICPAHGDGISLFATNSLMQKYERDEFWIARYARYEPSGPVLQNEANGFSFDSVSSEDFYIHNIDDYSYKGTKIVEGYFNYILY